MIKSLEACCDFIDLAIESALAGESRMDPEVLKINGFSTPTMRHLFNNLCNMSDGVYLEVGTFCGATFCAALNNNPIHAIGIDDFSQPFDHTNAREQFYANLERWQLTAKTVRFIEEPCFNLAGLTLPKPVDVYFYDGEHSYNNQARALPAFFEMMADQFIHLVDDTNWDDVKRGTADGLRVLEPHLRVEKQWNLVGDASRSDDPIWHNGLDIYLISKVK